MRHFYRKFVLGGGLLTAIALAAAACTDFSHTPDSLGNIKILVVDSATNVGVGTVRAVLMLEDRTPWREVVTSSDGSGEFGVKDGGVIPGKFLVFLDLTGKGYVLAAGEENYKFVRSVIGQTATVNFKLHKGIVTGPPGS